MGKNGNGEGSIYPHNRNGKKVGYRGAYVVHTAAGPKRHYVSGKTRQEVADKMADSLSNRNRGLVFQDDGITVGDYLDRWLKDAVRGTVRESTYSRDAYLVANHAKLALGRLRLRHLKAIDLQGLYRDRLETGLSPSTVQKLHHVLHKALAQAVRWDMISRNPADAVKPPSPTKKQMRPLSADEARRLLEVARGDRLEALYVLAVHTGMRRGELLALRWEDVDFDAATVRVRRTLTRIDNGRRLAFGEPKTKKSRRTVNLTPRATEALKSHRAIQAEERLRVGSLYEDQRLIFAGNSGGPINPSNLRQRSFGPLLERARLPKISFHDLRHTCASLLFQRNLHPKHVQDLLGHASVSITLDTYSHMLPGMGGEAADAMSEALG